MAYFVLYNTLLTWYNMDPSQKPDVAVSGSLNLTGAQVKGTIRFQSMSIKPTVGNMITLTATTKAEATEWLLALKNAVGRAHTDTGEVITPVFDRYAGWVTKKYIGDKKCHKRFMDLKKTDFVLRYYDNININSCSPKGEVALAGAKVVLMDKDTFMISTAHGRDYPFQCSNDPEQATIWVSMLEYVIREATKKVDEAVYKHIWLIVGGKTAYQSEKWAVVTFNRGLMWFDMVMPPENISENFANGCIDLTGAKVERHAQKVLCIRITPVTGQPLNFHFADSVVFKEWFYDLLKLSQGTGKVKPKSKTFDVPLHVLLELEKTEIPRIVTSVVQYLESYGLVRGIFRVSGAASEVEQYTNALDRGQVIDFEEYDADVNAVAGLLKLFLRKLPEPLLQTDLYPHFLKSDCSNNY
eukprot:TRINITY_DN6102_c0_g6_i3.p1 TRINITY_DN6102_c0_g6~~TRINITY_DN6102_c0_g6_i3.p1  ORF type:complete len:412 (-),score=91.15 TRINITY_DN6102_c0_g6_i3:280-1515(-)